MRLEFDPAKDARNIRERGLSFELVGELVWKSALVVEDTRRDYGERRFRVLGRIGNRVFAVVVTPRPGGLRVISLRRANPREEKRYVQAIDQG